MPKDLRWTPERAAFYAARDLHHVMSTMSEDTKCRLFPEYADEVRERERRRRLRIEAEAEGRLVPVRR